MGRLRGHLGFSKWSDKIGTCVWIASLKSLKEPDAQTLLVALTRTGHVFFEVHHGLPAVVDALSLSTTFMTEWFPALIKRLGDDMDCGGEWGAIARYCEKTPTDAIEVADGVTRSTGSDTYMRIAAELIGVLRSLGLDTPQRDQWWPSICASYPVSGRGYKRGIQWLFLRLDRLT